MRSNSLASRLCRNYGGARTEQSLSARFSERARTWWETLAAREDWRAAGELGELCAAVCPDEAFGWENWAWALHKQGRTSEAYKVLAPILRQLRLPGPPSGRAAYCLACFCAALGRKEEGVRWLRLAEIRAVNKKAFRTHIARETELHELWALLNSPD